MFNWFDVFLPLLLQIAVIIFAGLIIKSIFSIFKLKHWYKSKAFVLIGACVLVAVIVFTYFCMPFVSTKRIIIISEVTTRNGIKMWLTQKHNEHIFKPYTISFCHKKGDDKSWEWFYIDHEDFFWWSGDIKINEDGKRATIFRGSKPLAYFDWEQETLTFLNSRGAIKSPQKK